jgi:NAD(P)-dependent dehydrogenase (short-subunit alcohol dehydrogenase family)
VQRRRFTPSATAKGLTEECREPATKGAGDRFNPERLFDLSGSTAMVTGAGSGIGAAVALGMARSGADLILADFANQEQLEAVASAARDMGRKAVAVKCDVRRRALVKEAMTEAVEAMGVGPDILFCSAGIIGRLERAEDVTHDGWLEVMATNVEGSYNAARACYPHMKKAGRGKVVFVSSIAGTRGAGAQVAYACSKGAVLPLSRSLASSWGKDNIQVNTLVPGAINTPFLNVMLANPRKLEYILGRIPLGRLGVAEDMVGPALFLCSHASDYVTGAEIAVDGGGAALPMLAGQDPEAYKPGN